MQCPCLSKGSTINVGARQFLVRNFSKRSLNITDAKSSPNV